MVNIAFHCTKYRIVSSFWLFKVAAAIELCIKIWLNENRWWVYFWNGLWLECQAYINGAATKTYLSVYNNYQKTFKKNGCYNMSFSVSVQAFLRNLRELEINLKSEKITMKISAWQDEKELNQHRIELRKLSCEEERLLAAPGIRSVIIHSRRRTVFMFIDMLLKKNLQSAEHFKFRRIQSILQTICLAVALEDVLCQRSIQNNYM